MRERLVVWGASSQALVVAEAAQTQGKYEIVGFLDDVNPERRGEKFSGATILGGSEQLESLRADGVEHLIVAVGDGKARMALADRALKLGFELATVIHASASVAEGVVLGGGVYVGAGAIIEPAVRIGANAVINVRSVVAHECQVGDGVHVACATLAGRVTVGPRARIEVDSTVLRGIRVGADSVIGAGSVVLHDIPDGVLAYGSPARVIRAIEDL